MVGLVRLNLYYLEKNKMKFLGINFNRKHTPELASLRLPVFNVTSHWILSLGIFFAILIIVGLVGAKFFYYGYTEGYKQETQNNPQNLINVDRLKNTVEKRNKFIIEPVVLPRDPSL
jgi:hypothetical protein